MEFFQTKPFFFKKLLWARRMPSWQPFQQICAKSKKLCHQKDERMKKKIWQQVYSVFGLITKKRLWQPYRENIANAPKNFWRKSETDKLNCVFERKFYTSPKGSIGKVGCISDNNAWFASLKTQNFLLEFLKR